jgi:hypothetical protein
VARLLGDRKPKLLVTDPPYGIELDTEWRDRAGLNSCGPAEASYMKQRTKGHTETTISGDTRADWSEAFELVPSLQIAYVWHASVFTREVLNGLLRIDFLYPQQIIWNKGRTVLTRTHYWYQHEPCWYVRKKNAPWFGKAGENSTIWDSPSPKFIMGGSDEEKYDHPTQKPVDLMRRPILNHTKRGELVYEPFLGSGTTLAAAELNAGRRSRTWNSNFAPGIRTRRGCAWRYWTGRRNCDCCGRVKGWPPLRHVWPTLALPALGWRDGQGCRDRRPGAVRVATKSRKARRGRSRAGRREEDAATD